MKVLRSTAFLVHKEQWWYPARAFYPISVVKGKGLVVVMQCEFVFDAHSFRKLVRNCCMDVLQANWLFESSSP